MSKVLVIGDSCLDIFEYGDCKRICPEAPVPVLIPTNKKENGGMAANVYENLKALGVNCDIITNKVKPVKIRYIDEVSNHMIIRVDRNDTIEELNMAELLAVELLKYDAIVISDYNKGFLTEEHIKYLSTHPITFMDSKKLLGLWASNIKFIKINEKEYQTSSLFLGWNYKNHLIVTQGKDGANYLTFKEHIKFPIRNEHPVRDLTGAGDTFLAGLVANYIETNDIKQAIDFANRCAAWAVTQKGVAVVSKNKLENNGYYGK